MSKYRQPSRYDLKKSIEVRVKGRAYFVFLDTEIVVQEVWSKGGMRVVRRITSRNIETTALLSASDAAHAAL